MSLAVEAFNYINAFETEIYTYKAALPFCSNYDNLSANRTSFPSICKPAFDIAVELVPNCVNANGGLTTGLYHLPYNVKSLECTCYGLRKFTLPEVMACFEDDSVCNDEDAEKTRKVLGEFASVGREGSRCFVAVEAMEKAVKAGETVLPPSFTPPPAPWSGNNTDSVPAPTATVEPDSESDRPISGAGGHSFKSVMLVGGLMVSLLAVF